MRSLSRVLAFATAFLLIFSSVVAAEKGGSGPVHVRGYTKKDGTYVAPYERSAPGTKGNSIPSPYTGLASPDPYAATKAHASGKAGDRPQSTINKPPETVVKRDEKGRIVRSATARHEFMRQTGYPKGRPGYVIDHIVSLKRGGCDCPENMQWQTIEEAKAKDKWE